MRDAVSLPVTVKHRIGIDRTESYGFVRDFVGTVGESGCSVFIVHARNAWLDGLSPKRNREVPPLRLDTVAQLKVDFPQWTFVVNGGLQERTQVEHELARMDGIMLGRVAYHDPWRLAEWDQLAFGAECQPPPIREAIETSMVRYMEVRAAHDGTPWTAIARHMMGLRLAQPGARRWRQVWSDHRLRALPPSEVMQHARLAMDNDPRSCAPPESAFVA
jgi:tRNA-dihydrouridine synthase A